ncbi:monovalent cation/H(+) antiporter subunit G [Tessaracoccus sp. ZS01]|uniref:monovalent cation/H(+) antiporter subunit G n=1 Tax=Tessaracoccus sp. ZS01 TaxID=1906324 RepID=UPI00096EB2CC|nr:monovalent cation/H(+) antiporter subunit G [Tessaracoccus sp. ZS01]MCG6567536.1 Na+/H+ antiporter subunit G [Tessaracoccus sp. ZS01]OMG55902.1 Na+/H+ antiporter subunit G [Tessaracoccus sp. ZS01]
MDTVFDFISALAILVGAILCFGAAVALVRFPDLLGRMHAITKPQVLGLIFVSVGIALSLRTWWALGLCLLIIALQLLTAPVSASMVSRSAYRSGLTDDSELLVNHLAEDLKDAGFRHLD